MASLAVEHRAFGIEHCALRFVVPTRTQQLGLLIVLAVLVVYVFIRVL